VSRLFICHATRDKPFVRRLAEAFDRHGVDVWVDEREIKVGDSLLTTIQSGLHNCEGVVVVLSRAAMERPWVQRELKAAFTLEVERRRKVIFPI
jgi:hypothetical protein